MQPRKTEKKSKLNNNALVIQDVLVISDYYKKYTLAGEFEDPHKFGGNKLDSKEDPKKLIKRLYNYISILINYTAKHHQSLNCKPGSIELKDEKKNRITRLLTNEFFFYTKYPLTLKDFEILQNKIFELAATLPENLHIVLATFAVKSPDNKILNVAVQIECGKIPKINFTIKNNPSKADPVYFEGVHYRFPLLNTDIDDHDPIYHINIKGKKFDLAFNNTFLCKTAGNLYFYSCIEICLDHYYRVARTNYDKALKAEILSSKKITYDQLTTLCVQSTVSNTIDSKEGCIIGNHVVVDPYYSNNPETKEKIQNKVRVSKVIDKDEMFGTDANIYIYSPQVIQEILFRSALIATELGNKKILKDCIKHGLDIDTIPKEFKSGETNPGKTLLMTAIEYNQKKIAQWLLKKGANPNLRSKDDMTVLHQAIELKINSKLIQLLLRSKGIKLNATDKNGNTPIHYAIEKNDIITLQDLLKQGADPNIRNFAQKTPLHWAIEINSKDSLYIVKLLLSHDADPFIENPSHQTPLHFAIANKNLAVISLLLGIRGTNFYILDIDGMNLFHNAAQYGIILLIDILKRKKISPNETDYQGNTCLHIATRHGNLEFAEKIISLDNVNLFNIRNETALHIAVRENNYDIAKLLIMHGADLELKNNSGKAPIMIAFLNNDIRMMKLLLESGANPHIEDKAGYALIHYAMDAGKHDVIKLLLTHKANINQLSKNKYTPIQLAIINGEFMTVKEFWDMCKIDINAKDRDGQTLLHHAALAGDPDMVAFLLAKGASPIIENKKGFTPGMIAKSEGYLDVVNTIAGYMLKNSPTYKKSSTANIRTELGKNPTKSIQKSESTEIKKKTSVAKKISNYNDEEKIKNQTSLEMDSPRKPR